MSTLIPKIDLKNGGSTPTGAINRPFNEKLAEIISVKDFGAIGNGITDDTAAIQAAIYYALAQSTYYEVEIRVDFPAGVYNTTGTLTIDGNGKAIVLMGYGMAEIAYSGTGDCIHIGNESSFGIMPVEIHNLALIQTGTAGTGNGLVVLQSAYSVFKNLNIRNFNNGVLNQGSIGVIYDFQGKGIFNCNYCIVFDSYQPTGGSLRFDSNLCQLLNCYIAANIQGVTIQPKAGVLPSNAGGLIRLQNVVFEGFGASAQVAVQVITNGEVSVLDEVTLDHCWFEGYGAKLLNMNNAKVHMTHCFIAQCNSQLIVLNDNTCELNIEHCYGYFNDAPPATGAIIEFGGTATSAVMSNVRYSRNLFSDAPLIYTNFPKNTLNATGNQYERVQQSFIVQYDAMYPIGNNDSNYGLALELFTEANKVFGLGWQVATVTFAGNDGTGNLGFATFKLYKVGAGFRTIDLSGTGATGYTLTNASASNSTCTFNNDGTGRWFKMQGSWIREN